MQHNGLLQGEYSKQICYNLHSVSSLFKRCLDFVLKNSEIADDGSLSLAKYQDSEMYIPVTTKKNKTERSVKFYKIL